MTRAKLLVKYLLLFFILLQLNAPLTAQELQITAHNNFISFTNFNAASSSRPLILLNQAWGDVLGFQSNKGGIRSLVDNNSGINELNADVPRLTRPALLYPSPFKFSEGSVLGYRLNKHMDIEFRVYDMRANEIFRKIYLRGEQGGLFGYNKVPFNEEIVGKRLPVGVYFYLVMTDGKVLGQGKFAILP